MCTPCWRRCTSSRTAECHRTFLELFDIDRKHVKLETVLQAARRWLNVCFGLESAWMMDEKSSGRGLEAGSLCSVVVVLAVSHRSITGSEMATCSSSEPPSMSTYHRSLESFRGEMQQCSKVAGPPLGLN
jgi:hypothetical protein